MKKTILFLGLALCYLTSFSQEQGSITDARDGKTYMTVKIGTQNWMAENLAYLPSVCTSEKTNGCCGYWVYGYEGTKVADAKATENYTKYGVLYNYYTAKDACPSGWHLPSDEEWKSFETYLGMSKEELVKVNCYRGKSISSDLFINGSTNFNVINSGAKSFAGGFNELKNSSFWTSTTDGTASSIIRLIDTSGIYYTGSLRTSGMSVRCIEGVSTETKVENTFLDTRDCKLYKTVKIGTQTWMAENLNYDGGNYKSNSYGKYYDYKSAVANAPKGWHLPTKEEYITLLKATGTTSTSGDKTQGNSDCWKSLCNGGTSGFNANFWGYYTNSTLYNVNTTINQAQFWTSTSNSKDTKLATSVLFSKENEIINITNWLSKTEQYFTVRYIKD